MERASSPVSKELKDPIDPLGAELDEIEDGDYREVVGGEINNSLDAIDATDESDTFLDLDPNEEITIPTTPDTDTEAQKVETETRQRQTAEAKLALKGSQRFDKAVLEYADKGMQKAETFAAAVGDRKYTVKDRYQQWRVDAHQDKLDRSDRLSKTAPTKFLRKHYAKKARLEYRRLEHAKGIQAEDRMAYLQLLDGDGILGERSTRRLERAKELQGRINRLIAAEYGFAKIGREYRDAERKQVKGEGDPRKRELLRRKLLEDTSSVAKLEEIGKNKFIDRMLAAYGASSQLGPVARYMSQ